MTKPKEQASKDAEIRRPGFILPEYREDHLTPAERLAEHLASKKNIGPGGRTTVRAHMRSKRGGEKGAEAPLVRSLYDIANTKPRRRRRRKGKKS